MKKKKIAESIIIRVGGGIREVPREPVESQESLDSNHLDIVFEQTEEAPPFGVELGPNAKDGSDKIIN